MIETFDELKKQQIPYADIDNELLELIRLLNTLPEIATISCCIGHNISQCHIHMAFKTIKALNDFCFNILNPFYNWEITIENNINRNQNYIFGCLSSSTIDLDKNIEQVNALINKINLWIKNEKTNKNYSIYRFRFRAFYNGNYIYKDIADSYYYNSNGLAIDLANTLPNNIVWEQCLGIVDKYGNLIYEGDNVKISVRTVSGTDTYVGKVYWNKEDCTFYVYVSSDCELTLYGNSIEIIRGDLDV